MPVTVVIQKLSIIVPVYNEAATVERLLRRVRAVRFCVDCEIIVVDDGSSDGSTDVLRSLAKSAKIVLVEREVNGGKGAAVRTALAHVTGQVVVVQDADLELDPADLPTLLAPILSGEAEVCYGSRFLARKPKSTRMRTAYWANAVLNGLSNLLNGLKITDFNTCYKMMTTVTMERLDLTENGFAMEAEITAKLAKLGQRIVERPISYQPRSWRDGKKIRPRDLLAYLTAMVRYRFLHPVDASLRPSDRAATVRERVLATGCGTGE